MKEIINSEKRVVHINTRWLGAYNKKRGILKVAKALLDNPDGFSS
jgi:hypothetical protein